MNTLVDRFTRRMAAVAPTERGCLEWPGARQARGVGYGSIMVTTGKTALTHRVAYEVARGPIPDGLWVLHRCDNKACVNVEHLFLGTHQDNMADMASKGRARPARFRGNDCPWSRISAADAAIIRHLAQSGANHRRLAVLYGVTHGMVSRIKLRKAWAHVPDLKMPEARS